MTLKQPLCCLARWPEHPASQGLPTLSILGGSTVPSSRHVHPLPSRSRDHPTILPGPEQWPRLLNLSWEPLHIAAGEGPPWGTVVNPAAIGIDLSLQSHQDGQPWLSQGAVTASPLDRVVPSDSPCSCRHVCSQPCLVPCQLGAESSGRPRLAPAHPHRPCYARPLMLCASGMGTAEAACLAAGILWTHQAFHHRTHRKLSAPSPGVCPRCLLLVILSPVAFWLPCWAWPAE